MTESNAVTREGPADPRPGRLAEVGSAGGRRGRRRRDDAVMVPDAHFQSYYGRPVVRPSPWEADIPAYLFLGGLAGGSSLLAAGAARSGRPALRRAGRLTALAGISGSLLALVHDLGRPARFVNMLRVAKPSSPMSMGTWLLSAYGPLAGLAAAGEVVGAVPALPVPSVVRRMLIGAAGPAGGGAAALAPALATYTAVLLSHTATPTWNAARRELPFVFAGSAAAAAGGMGLLAVPLAENTPAVRFAVGGAVLDLVASAVMERSLGVAAEPLHTGVAGRRTRAAQVLTAAGGLGAALLGGRSRVGAALSGLALVAGSVATRFAIFEAGQESARDPRYTVVPQRQRLADHAAAAAVAGEGGPPSG